MFEMRKEQEIIKAMTSITSYIGRLDPNILFDPSQHNNDIELKNHLIH